MIAELRAGLAALTDGAVKELRGDHTGALVTTDAHGRYAEAVRLGNVYMLGGAAMAPTAFVGAAGGTPLLSIYNPVGSGKNLFILSVNFAIKVVDSAIGWTSLSIWGGVSAANTGTLTTPTNMLTLQTGGSVAKGSVNAATTSTTAITSNGPLMPVASHFWGTSVGVGQALGNTDVAGQVVCAPGNLVAVGLSVAPASLTVDCSMIWEEVTI